MNGPSTCKTGPAPATAQVGRYLPACTQPRMRDRQHGDSHQQRSLRPNHPTPSNNAITGAARRLVTPAKRQNDSMGDQERVCETKSLVFHDFAIIWGERPRSVASRWLGARDVSRAQRSVASALAHSARRARSARRSAPGVLLSVLRENLISELKASHPEIIATAGSLASVSRSKPGWTAARENQYPPRIKVRRRHSGIMLQCCRKPRVHEGSRCNRCS